MSFFASIFHSLKEREFLALETAFMLYAVMSFLYVAGYVTAQIKEERLIKNENSPIPFVASGVGGWCLILGVVALLLLQSPLFMVLVVLGVSSLMTLNGQTAREQFGLGRLPAVKVIGWSLLVCGAVVAVEIPLSEVIETALNAIHLPHPEQQTVEMFRKLNQPSEIILSMIQAILIAPLIEELFFRGFLLTFFTNYMPIGIAVFFSAAIFAFAHANLDSVIPLWLLGVILGVAYQHTGSLLLPIGIHACWNFFTAISLLLEKGSS